MLHVLKTTTESDPSNAQPENANFPRVDTLVTYASGNVYAVSVESGIPVVNLRAGVVDGKVALWLDHDGSEKLFGEPDILEITGPPAVAGVELRINDFIIGAVTYKVSGTNDSGCMTGAWPRNEAENGIKCVLSMPSGSEQVNWIKFTIAAEPPSGHPVPTPLDPLGVIKKEG